MYGRALVLALGLLAALPGCEEAGGVASRPAAPAPPRRILPANASAVDFVLALVEPVRVVSIPRTTSQFARDLPQLADWDPARTFGVYETETVLALDPDLVITHAWQSPQTTALLRERGLRVVEIPTVERFDDVLATIDLLGQVLAARERAAGLRAELEARRDALAADDGRRALRALSYTNLGVGGWTAGAGTTADVVIGLAGMQNAAAQGGRRSHYQIDIERLLELDPDVIVVGAEDGAAFGAAAAYLAHEPALRHLAAVREGRVVELSADLFATNSFHLLSAAEVLARAVERLFPTPPR